jgi:HEAT repeat protein
MSNLTMTEAIENLQNDDVSIRKEAIESLIGVTDEAAIDPLIEATTDENAQVRFKAAEILGNMGNVAFDRLVSKFESETGKNKRFLAFALKETNNEKAIPLFAQAVSDEDFGVRKVSIRALGELQAHDELDTIAKGLDDEDWGVRLAAIYACADLASDDSIALIKKARRDESDKDFKKSCNKAIKKAEKNQKAKAEGKVVSNTIPMKTIKEMEKTNPQKAIKEYKKYVQSESDKDAPYKRLAILYRKLRQDENEIAVLEKAIEVLSVKKPGKEDWFVKRLAKMK